MRFTAVIASTFAKQVEGLSSSKLRHVKQLEEGNTRLKGLIADVHPDLFSIDELKTSLPVHMEFIGVISGKRTEGVSSVPIRNFKISFYASFKKRFLEGDLLEALKAYDVWLFLAWLDVRLRYRRSRKLARSGSPSAWRSSV